jgi:LPXTG-motif cell wall-anchored protein
VGGEVYPVDKASLLAPWLGLSIVLILAAGGLILRRRRSR